VTPAPSAESQLEFLSKLQRLFNEGDFTATYKYALLIAMADLSVEHGRDDGEPLKLSHRQLAQKFIELYWQQSAPYSAGTQRAQHGLLAQNKGTQAAVISAIVAFRQKHPSATAQGAQTTSGYSDLLRRVAQTVSAQPVNYLQNMGGTTDTFLYQREIGHIVLNAGVAYCLRRFQPLVQQLARSHWVGHIKSNRLNHSILGSNDDLEAFLFETPRHALTIIGKGLRKLNDCRCFYCESKVNEADVDHFVPFSMYPRDLAHNFVLAHPSCNRSKSDTLAALPHLERWLEFITKNDTALQEIGAAAGRSIDMDSTRAVARWGYSNALMGGGQAWRKASDYEPVTDGYMRALA
jgi:5-methylcytosine-specific restriction endonuclease McrA